MKELSVNRFTEVATCGLGSGVFFPGRVNTHI